MPNIYGSVAQVKLQADIKKDVQDNLIGQVLAAASQAVDRFCNRPDGFLASQTATARLYAGSGDFTQRIDECVEVTLVEVKDSPTDDTYVEWESTEWIAFSGSPESPDFNATPYTWLQGTVTGNIQYFTGGRFLGRAGFRPDSDVPRYLPTVRITARWGYADEVPDLVAQAAVTLAARWIKRAGSGWSDTLVNAELGTLVYRLPVDPDVSMMLSHARFVKPAIGRR